MGFLSKTKGKLMMKQLYTAVLASFFIFGLSRAETDGENLFASPSEFNSSAWTNTNTVEFANDAIAPNGTTTADKLRDTVTTGSHAIYQVLKVTAGKNYIFQVDAKKGTKDYIRLWYSSNTQFGINSFAHFDLNVPAVEAVSGGVTATIKSLGNGWYRCRAMDTAVASGAAYNNIYIASSSSSPTYPGDGSGEVYLHNARFMEELPDTTETLLDEIN